jgi:hypothetical protein
MLLPSGGSWIQVITLDKLSFQFFTIFGFIYCEDVLDALPAEQERET